MNFALIGAAGYIAPRHLEAIRDLGHNLVVAYDKSDSVGILDRYFPECSFFTDFEKFADFLSSQDSKHGVDVISICSPNYMHKAHIKWALSQGCDVVCEKPLVLHEKDLDDIIESEKKYNKQVSTVLQLRVHDQLIGLHQKLIGQKSNHRHKVTLDYITTRGPWYLESWKGDPRKSGGLSSNIGVHFFDMLIWLFGELEDVAIEKKTPVLEKGTLRLQKADVEWRLSIDRKELSPDFVRSGKTTFRSIKVDGEEIEFSEGFTDLHKKIYANALSGNGFGVEVNRQAVRIVERIRGL